MTVRSMTMALRREMVAAAQKVAGEDRVRKFVVNNNTVDRYNTIIEPRGGDFTAYRKLPTVLVQHGHAFDGMPVARCKDIRVVGNETIADLEFLSPEAAPMADRMMALVDAGVLATSIRMGAVEVEYDASRETGDEFQDWFNPPLNYLRWELLEISLVNVPGNADALLKRQAELPEDQVRAFATIAARAQVSEPAPPLSKSALAELRAAALKKRGDVAPDSAPPAPEPTPTLPPDLSAIAAEVIEEVVQEELRAQKARRSGNTSHTATES